MSRNTASGGGYRYYTGSSRQEGNYDDGHVSIISAAGAGNGSACGTGNCKFGGHSYQNYFENCGDLSGTANGFGHGSFAGDGYYVEV